jgi:hypothetical protein
VIYLDIWQLQAIYKKYSELLPVTKLFFTIRTGNDEGGYSKGAASGLEPIIR